MNKKESIKEIQYIIKYKFKNIKNLYNCLSHPVFNPIKNKSKKKHANEFERLEFLGDRVLGLTIASLIYNKFQKLNEGDLTKKFSFLVQRDFLYKIALELKLNIFLKYNIQNINHRLNKSILSDFVESLIGAIFVDGGIKEASKFITFYWNPYLDLTESNETESQNKITRNISKKI